MKVAFSSDSISGAEILERNPGVLGINLETFYKYKEGTRLFGGKIECEADRILTDEEQALRDKRKEIKSLNDTIAKKKLRDMDYSAELARLNELDPI